MEWTGFGGFFAEIGQGSLAGGAGDYLLCQSGVDVLQRFCSDAHNEESQELSENLFSH